MGAHCCFNIVARKTQVVEIPQDFFSIAINSIIKIWLISLLPLNMRIYSGVLLKYYFGVVKYHTANWVIKMAIIGYSPRITFHCDNSILGITPLDNKEIHPGSTWCNSIS